MTASYQVWIKDASGTRVAILTDEAAPVSGVMHTIYQSLHVTHLENKPGVLRLQLDGNSRAVASLIDGAQIEVYRRTPFRVQAAAFFASNPTIESGLNPARGWYREWAGFFESESIDLDENGRLVYVAQGVEYLDLVDREKIAYFAGTAFSAKSGAGETVIKAYVNENLGPGANNVNRFYDGVRSGLSIEADSARGSNWEGQRTYKYIGETISEIAAATGLAYDIVGTGPGTFEFRVYAGQRGKDRSTVGLDPATGLNGAGLPPVVFSDKRRNIRKAHYGRGRSGEKNTVLVLGGGDDTNRAYQVIENTSSIDVHPWNRRSTSINASQETTAQALMDRGNAELEKLKQAEVFTVEPLQLESLSYGVHYWFGDKLTTGLREIVRHKKLIGVKITSNPSEGETLAFDLADVAGY